LPPTLLPDPDVASPPAPVPALVVPALVVPALVVPAVLTLDPPEPALGEPPAERPLASKRAAQAKPHTRASITSGALRSM
jgi:hypothetical protein